MFLYRYSKDLRKDASGYAYSSWKRHYKHIHEESFRSCQCTLGCKLAVKIWFSHVSEKEWSLKLLRVRPTEFQEVPNLLY